MLKTKASLYTDSCCDDVLDMMKEGASVAHYCKEAGISQRTFYNWAATIPEFRDAHEKGSAASLAYWLDVGKNCLNDKTFDTKNWKQQLLVRFSNNRVYIPELKTATTISLKFQCIQHAVADAKINVEQAEKLSNIIYKEQQATEIEMLQKRIEALESANSNNSLFSSAVEATAPMPWIDGGTEENG